MNEQQQIEVGCQVQLGSFHRWYTVISVTEWPLILLESEAGGHFKADKTAISPVRKAQGIVAMARDLGKLR